jgi:hypothetical protein
MSKVTEVISDWTHLQVMDYTLEQPYILSIEGFEESVLMIPNSFLEVFRRADGIEVAGDILDSSWGASQYLVDPEKGEFRTYRNKHRQILKGLSNHKAKVVKNENMPRALRELKAAREYTRRIVVSTEWGWEICE